MARPESGDRASVGETFTVLVYDARSGDIVHGHKELVLAGGEAPAEDELRTRVMEIAARVTDRDADGLRTLMVSEDDLEVGAFYRVDPKRERLEKLSADQAVT
jgi:predicted RecA/RadA family phage recombinase